MSNFSATLAPGAEAFTNSKFGIIEKVKSAWSKVSARQSTDEVGQFIEQHGGVLTDSLEREISRRFGGFAG